MTLERALHAALDARRDPLADEDVVLALVDEPERFGEVARAAQQAAVLAEEGGQRAGAERRVRRVALPIAASLAAAGVALFFLVLRGDGEPLAPVTPHAAAHASVPSGDERSRAAESAVHDVHLLVCTVETENALGRTTTTLRRRPDDTTSVERAIREVAPDGSVLELTTLRRLR